MTVRDDWRPAFFWIVGILAAIILTATTWTLSTASDNDGRITTIEMTAFSKEDATRLELRLLDQIAKSASDNARSTEEIKKCLNYIQQGRQCP